MRRASARSRTARAAPCTAFHLALARISSANARYSASERGVYVTALRSEFSGRGANRCAAEGDRSPCANFSARKSGGGPMRLRASARSSSRAIPNSVSMRPDNVPVASDSVQSAGMSVALGHGSPIQAMRGFPPGCDGAHNSRAARMMSLAAAPCGPSSRAAATLSASVSKKLCRAETALSAPERHGSRTASADQTPPPLSTIEAKSGAGEAMPTHLPQQDQMPGTDDCFDPRPHAAEIMIAAGSTILVEAGGTNALVPAIVDIPALGAPLPP